MRLATRLFASISLLVAAAVVGSIVAADRVLRRHLEVDTAAGLEREARLLATLIPADSSQWPEFARLTGARLGRRVTLIDSTGRVRGDTEFDRAALARLENHAARPEVRAAVATGTGQATRLSASTNERQLYVAVRGGPAGPAVVRVSASLVAVDARLHAVQRAVAGAGLVMLALAALFAWLLAGLLARPLVALAGAARDIAAGRPAAFPDVRIPELARHVDALREMHEELERRFAALRREREESRTLLEALTDGVVAADDRGTIVSSNAAARRLLGYGAAESLPPLAQLFHDQPHRSLVRELLAGRPVERRELILGERTVLVSGRPLEGGGTLLVLSDVTDVRRLEAVRRDFVANVSHELKTPLTAIAGYAETLVHEAPAGSQPASFAHTIVQNARRMQHLVDDLLDLSRIESGGWRPQPRVVEVEAAARDAWSSFSERARGASVRFETTVARDALAVPVDPDSLRQIFTNLFDNALRHTPRGGVIRVAAELEKDGIALSVADTGSGIPAEHLSRIFERFYRVDPGRAREQGGTGLGLAIVKHLVEAHGGRVDAESVIGRGTTISMLFPLVTRP
ncbi:MAG TPA: ATP-binding protein [Gemmatimonadales bacterium]|jgi:PAS domain S-box-containing protein|nr:ATP-binding protein [Gemmatimonadales bacterium]